MLSVDLNCDMGEGMSNDSALMKYISTANIACGGHAGDDDSIRRTIEMALENGVAIGAHPSYNDKENFGRIEWLEKNLSFEQLKRDLIRQLTKFSAICDEFGIKVHHVKPHGALYNRAAKDREVAELIAAVMLELNYPRLLYGLSGSPQETITDGFGIRFVKEVFSDRTYQTDGSLTPRSVKGALIEDSDTSIRQVLAMVKAGTVKSLDGIEIAVKAETICIHSDGSQALDFAINLRSTLEREGVVVEAP